MTTTTHPTQRLFSDILEENATTRLFKPMSINPCCFPSCLWSAQSGKRKLRSTARPTRSCKKNTFCAISSYQFRACRFSSFQMSQVFTNELNHVGLINAPGPRLGTTDLKDTMIKKMFSSFKLIFFFP